MGLQQCSVCKKFQKSLCIKKACKVDGLTPVMVYETARKDKVKKKRKRCEDDEEDDGKEGDEEDKTKSKSVLMKGGHQDHIFQFANSFQRGW